MSDAKATAEKVEIPVEEEPKKASILNRITEPFKRFYLHVAASVQEDLDKKELHRNPFVAYGIGGFLFLFGIIFGMAISND